MSVLNEARSRIPKGPPKLLLVDQVISTLEKIPGVNGVKLTVGNSCDKLSITSWEQRNCCLLPTDLKNFYLAHDGMKIVWRFKLKIGEHLSLGHCNVNCLNDLKRLGVPGSVMVEQITTPINSCQQQKETQNHSSKSASGENSSTPNLAEMIPKTPRKLNLPTSQFSPKCKIFELDQNRGQGTVCLVYGVRPRPSQLDSGQDSNNRHHSSKSAAYPNAHDPEIWFLDKTDNWHYLAPTFTQYYRMMLLHLGLPFWQYSFTPQGLPRDAKIWFQHFIPKLTDHSVKLEKDEGEDSPKAEEIVHNKIDPNIFKIKSKHSSSHPTA